MVPAASDLNVATQPHSIVVVHFMSPFLLSCSLALCGVTIVVGQPHCPNPWSYNPDTKHCYLAVRRYSTFDQAQSDCRHLYNRSQLVTVHDDKENEFVQNLPLVSASWIGARARFDLIDAHVGLIHPGLVLRWPNGDLVRYANWDYWNGTLEMDASRMCVIVNLRGRWQNYPCSKQAQFVCKREANQFDRREVDEEEECPPRWTINRSTQSCYLVIGAHDLTMLRAEQQCQDIGKKHGREAFLTSIVNSAENQFVHNLAKSKHHRYRPIYLGAVGNYSSPHAWTWLDGAHFSAFKNWANKMPHGNVKQAALLMDRDGFWTNTYADRPVVSNRRNIGVCKMSAE